MRRKAKTWYCKIYKFKFCFCVGWKREDFFEFYKKELNGGARTRESLEAMSGLCIEVSNPSGVVIWTDPEDKKHHHRALMHECIHAACFTLNTRGVGIDWPTCEPITYLAEALFYEALEGAK